MFLNACFLGCDILNDIFNRVCSKCGRIVDLNDFSINEGRPYHDHCLLQTTRTRISQLSDKVARGTANILDGKELQDLLFVEQRMKEDMETASKFRVSNQDRPVFKGNTALGLHSTMNPPAWKKLLARGESLEGTKYHMHKTKSVKTTEPVWQITTDENGHKGVIQIGSKPIDNTQNKMEGSVQNNKLLSDGQAVQTTSLTTTKKEDVDYELERLNINIWRGFELLQKLIPSFESLDIYHRIKQLNFERTTNFEQVVA